jgi:hypothetical protein
MQRVIRVYAIVDLVALGAFFAIYFSNGWGAPLWNLVAYEVANLVAQLWVLLIIPLGVLSGSDAARLGRRGWLVAFIALTVVAVAAPRINDLRPFRNPVFLGRRVGCVPVVAFLSLLYIALSTCS